MKTKLILLGLFVSFALFGQGMNVMHTTSRVAPAAEVSGVDSANWEPEYKVIYYAQDVLGNPPHIDTADITNTMVESLVDGEYWGDFFDALYLYATTDTTGGTALINLINPGTFDCTETGAGALTWDLGGYIGDGTNHLSMNYNPSSNAINFELDSATIGVYVQNNSEQAASDIGGDGLYLFPRFTGNGFYMRVNQATTNNDGPTNADSRGTFMATRTGAEVAEGYINGASAIVSTTTSSSVADNTLEVFSRAGNNAWSTHQISIAFVSEGMSDTDASNINTIFETYMDAIGKGVQ